MSQEFPLNYKQYDTGIRIFDESLLEVDINRTFEMMDEEIPKDQTEEFESTATILHEFVNSCKGNSMSYMKEMLKKLLNYTRKVPLNDCAQELTETEAANFLFLSAKHADLEVSLLAFGILLNITAISKKEYDPFNTPVFFEFLLSFFNENTPENILALVIACLANYALDSLENRNAVMEKFPISLLNEQFDQIENKYVKQEITHLIYNYSKYGLEVDDAMQIIEFSKSILENKINSCYQYALWTLVMISRNNEDAIEHIYSKEFIELLDNEVLSYEDPHGITNAALILIYLFINKGLEIPLINLCNITNCLLSDHDSTQTQALIVLKEFIITLPDSIPTLLRSSFFSNITELLHGSAKYITKLEAAHVFCYMVTKGDMQVCERLCITGGVSELVAFFGYDDDGVTLHSLKALFELFRCASILEGRLYRQMLSRFKTVGGFEQVYELCDIDTEQDEQKEQIAAEARSIVEEFFEDLVIDDIPLEDLGDDSGEDDSDNAEEDDN